MKQLIENVRKFKEIQNLSWKIKQLEFWKETERDIRNSKKVSDNLQALSDLAKENIREIVIELKNNRIFQKIREEVEKMDKNNWRSVYWNCIHIIKEASK